MTALMRFKSSGLDVKVVGSLDEARDYVLERAG
jgi:hypothetical protein